MNKFNQMNSGHRKVTIYTVARQASVSKTTISRYLNGSYQFMSEETKKRIAQTIADLHYRPNKVAQNFKLKIVKTIGIVLADIGNPFSSLVIKGVDAVCREKGFQLLVMNSNNQRIEEQRNLQLLIDRNVNGVILQTTGGNEAFLKDLQARLGDCEFVLIDREIPSMNISTVTTNDELVMKNLMKTLAGFGYQHYVLVTQDPEHVPTRAIRKKILIDFVHDHDSLNWDEIVVDLESETKLEAFFNILTKKDEAKRSVIVAVNDVSLNLSLEALARINAQPGKKIGVCGFGNMHLTKLTMGGITVVDQSSEKIGEYATRLLIDNIIGETPQHGHLYKVEAKLHVRHSTVKLIDNGCSWG